MIQARAQVLDSLGYDMVVVGVPAEELAVLRVLGAITTRVETSRTTRTGRTHPATAAVLAVRSPIVIGVLVSTVLFGAVAIRHFTHLLSKVLWFDLLMIAYTKTKQKVNYENFSFPKMRNRQRLDELNEEDQRL